MDPTRFRESPAGHVVKAGPRDAPYWAFVPHPLPPTLVLNPATINALDRAGRALGELAGLGRTLPNPHLLIGPFIRREAVSSSRIEGTQADIGELYAFEAGRPTKAPADVHEVSNYVKAMEYGLDRLKTLPVSLRLIREVHGVLLKGVRGEMATPGEFRTVQNWIGKPGQLLSEAEFVPPPVPAMLDALSDLERYLHADNTYPPLVRLAFIHSQFETIHPFIDGNGRIGRLLVSFLMVNWDLLPAPLLYLSTYLEQNRPEYYDLLRAVSERGAWQEWVAFFLKGVERQAQDAIHRAKLLQDLLAEWHRRLQEEKAPGWMFGIVDSLFQVPTVSSGDVMRQWHVTLPTAVGALERLRQMGILEETTNRRRRRLYTAIRIVEVVE